MKKPTLLLCLLVITFVLSCKDRQANTERTFTELTEDTSLFVPLHIYKTSDGYTIVDSIGGGPQNEKISFYDRRKRLVALAGTTSECGVFTFVKILYDEDSNIIGYTTLDYMSEMEDSIYNTQTSDDEMFYPYQRLLIDQVLEYDNDQENLSRYYFHKDNNGNVIEVSDPKTGKCIKAQKGYHITSEVVENENFWCSDLHGGLILLNFYIKPIDKKVKNYTITKYYLYNIQFTQHYHGNVIDKSVLYSKETHKPIYSILRKENKDTTMYERTYTNNSKTYRSKWENNRLLSTETINRNGTIIRENVYMPSADGKAYIRYTKQYDFKTKNIVLTDERRIDKKNMMNHNEKDNMMCMKDELSENWRDCY